MADLHPRLRGVFKVTLPPHVIGKREVPRVRPIGAGVGVALKHRHHHRPRHTVRHQALGGLQRL
eukprot:3708819-Prorocentrum_lima.AAC.1